MAEQSTTFECEIVDAPAGERFLARATLTKKFPIGASRIDKGRIELAHIYITSLADRWKGAGATITGDEGGLRITPHDEVYAVRNDRSKDHSHFVLFDLTGHGKYIRRNKYGNDVEVRICSTWDLGVAFGSKVAEALGALS